MRNVIIESPRKPKLMSDRKLEEIYGVPRTKLAKLRIKEKGPKFFRLGYRTVLYDVAAFEKWLEGLPGGGGERL
jgi:hypothetical protein